MDAIDIMMSGTRLFEALKAEARRTGETDLTLIRRWNERCRTLGAKLDHERKIRKQGLPASALLAFSYHAAR